ncbi:50S ribosomal protein L7/L12 [Natranaerofaba carboxydovora]|uniref:50S ribosomal protein L7/L12 n=1 Tax=Natranaerofaba carboxydovora TaxID=2742683 RepID=UPI001F136F0A|nr:50S ribosomal protein L7/L12 [Natranaerofaba carboxydovora]UMZ75384.1 50S ribosomal protein L7/L12 [Natranaerofaba carboxydovora]
MSKVQEVLDIVKEMSVLELSELVKEMEEEFGVSAQAPVAMAGAPAAGAGEAEAGGGEAEQTEFDVVLTDPGQKKIQVIKTIKEATGVGLKDAKAMADDLPKAVKEKASKEEAEELKEKIEEAGGSAEVK